VQEREFLKEYVKQQRQISCYARNDNEKSRKKEKIFLIINKNFKRTKHNNLDSRLQISGMATFPLIFYFAASKAAK
jgi:hypothetical protein